MDDKTTLTPGAGIGLPPIEVPTPMETPLVTPPVEPTQSTVAPTAVSAPAPSMAPAPIPMMEPQSPIKMENPKSEAKGVSVFVLLIVAIASLILGLGIGYFVAGRMTGVPTLPPTPGQEGSGTACTLEAKLCPDGTSVGRVGPNCEFAACPGETAPSAVTPAPEGTAPGVPPESSAPVAP